MENKFEKSYNEKKSLVGKRVTGEIKSTVTTMPGIDTQSIRGGDNQRIQSASVGDSNVSTGYFLSHEKLQPSIQRASGLPGTNLNFRGVQGGSKKKVTNVVLDTFFSFEGTRDDSGTYSGINSVSMDTMAYFKPLLDIVSVARRTAATFMPIMQATLTLDNAASSSEKRVIHMGCTVTNQTRPNSYQIIDDWRVFYPSLANVLQCSEADLFVALYVDSADKDVAFLAYQLQKFIDICFNHSKILVNQYYNHRDTIRQIQAYTRRSAVQKPVQLLAERLKTLPFCTGNYYGFKDWILDRPFQKSFSSIEKVNITNRKYMGVERMAYSVGGGPAQVWTPFPKILPHTRGYMEINNNISWWNDEFDFEPFYDAIVTDNLNAAVTFIDNVIAQIRIVTPMVSTKYNSLKALHADLNGNLFNTKIIDLPLEISREDVTYAYADYWDNVQSTCFATWITGRNGLNNAWVFEPEYAINADRSLITRMPINDKGEYPSIANSDMYIKNIPAYHDHDYHESYASGVIAVYSRYMAADNTMFTNVYTQAANVSYSNNYILFIDDVLLSCLGLLYSVNNGAVTVQILGRPKNLITEDVVLTTPKIDDVYTFGLINQPASKGSVVK